MEIKLRQYSSIYILDIIGEIDLYNCKKIKDLINKLVIKKIKSCILNFENVTYIDSSGVGSLIFAHSSFKENSINYYLSNLKGSVRKIVELTKLNGYLPITDNIADAIKELNKKTG
jgi:anti-sigma B factor antagonist